MTTMPTTPNVPNTPRIVDERDAPQNTGDHSVSRVPTADSADQPGGSGSVIEHGVPAVADAQIPVGTAVDRVSGSGAGGAMGGTSLRDITSAQETNERAAQLGGDKEVVDSGP